MTVIVLSVLILLLVGFLSNALTERHAAQSYADSQKAKLIAYGAVNHAIDLLRTNIPEPARLSQGPDTAPGNNWYTNPGQLTVTAGSGGPATIPLHTGAVTTPPSSTLFPDQDSIDLNQPLPGSTVPAITALNSDGTRPVMRVNWVNLVQDPTQLPNPTNRLTGRYAFWMDDESGRINFNTAVGKPPATSGTMYGDELNPPGGGPGFLTPLFTLGDSSIVYSGTGKRQWALGRPQSVNLDHLFTTPSQLLSNNLVDQVFLHGFARYPEEIMNFVSLSSQTPLEWYNSQKYNLTFYSRSPEFNAFGLPRFYTTFVPQSLEGGPSYQNPFSYTGSTASGSPVLHLSSLFGTFGFTNSVADEDGGTVDGGNEVNQEQLTMLLAYMQRQWPGYTGSFSSKYGQLGCTQIALNMLLMARLATTTIATDLTSFSEQWGLRTTSVNYCPQSTEYPGCTPERFYWRFTDPTSGSTVLMLPQMPGPYITEVRLLVNSAAASPPPSGDSSTLKAYSKPRYIQYCYEVEYYMPPFGPVVDISQFPMRMDYLDINASGAGKSITQQFGPTDGSDTRAARNWNDAANLGLLQIQPADGTALGPVGSSLSGSTVQNRIVVRSNVFTLGQGATTVPQTVTTGATTDYTSWNPFVFDAAKGGVVSVTMRFRPGMGVGVAPARPRQMIPLGLTQTDTLQAQFSVNLTTPSVQQAYSWQILDPQLSSTLAQWTAGKTGPGTPSLIGTPGAPNVVGGITEPSETSSQKSKMRTIERTPATVTIAGYPYDRNDENDSASRVSSPGYWSLIHTGMQSLQPWSTVNLGPAAGQTSPPDWLLLDLIGATYPMVQDQWKINNTLPDSFNTVSYMHSTAGQVNLNTRVFPRSPYFQAPERNLPLEAVFENLGPSGNASSLVSSIISYQTDQRGFGYIGELSNVSGYSGAGGAGNTQWNQELLLRNMAGCLTTKSNTFGVWGVAQAVRKITKNTGYGIFEPGDQVTGEKRFYALIERYIWPGKDGVPGNGHTTGGGQWDRLATQSTTISVAGGVTNNLFQLPGSPPLIRSSPGAATLNLDTTGSYPPFDGPEPVGTDSYIGAALGNVTWQPSTLENAYNPPQPVIKYRVVYFKYLDE